MAKESMKAREVKRAKLVARYAEKRAALKKIIATTDDIAEAYEAARKLQSIPKNANPIRLHNRCKITGRPKGYIRQFGISRIQFREMASQGLIPGVKKASWYDISENAEETVSSVFFRKITTNFFNIVGVVPIN